MAPVNGDEWDLSNYEAVPYGSCNPHVVAAGTVLPGRKRYLCYFIYRHLEFRLPETEALGEMIYGSINAADGLPVVVWELPFTGLVASPFWYVHLPSEEIAIAIAERSLLIRALIEVWGEGTSWDELHSEVALYDSEAKAKYGAVDQSFRFIIDGWARTVPQEEQVNIIESFEPCTGFKGPIQLRTAMHKWWVIVADPEKASMLPPLPRRYYFGRQIAAGNFRSMINTYTLKQRRYLGPTSMDPELSFLMCAMCGVKRSSLVIDPFAGTGSILVSAAACGAFTLGTDIDIRVIKFGKKDAKGEPVNIWTNFQDYGLPPPLGLLRCDLHRSPFRPGAQGLLDAVLADPPYGVRAGGRKSHAVPEIIIQDRGTHIASTAPYSLAECLRDLIENAARWLVVGGKICYWVPAAPGYYFESELPTHPVMEMVANCEQLLGSKYSRRLVVMRKVAPYDAEAAAAHYKAVGPPLMAQDGMHDYVYGANTDDTEEEDGEGKGKGRRSFRCKTV